MKLRTRTESRRLRSNEALLSLPEAEDQVSFIDVRKILRPYVEGLLRKIDIHSPEKSQRVDALITLAFAAMLFPEIKDRAEKLKELYNEEVKSHKRGSYTLEFLAGQLFPDMKADWKLLMDPVQELRAISNIHSSSQCLRLLISYFPERLDVQSWLEEDVNSNLEIIELDKDGMVDPSGRELPIGSNGAPENYLANAANVVLFNPSKKKRAQSALVETRWFELGEERLRDIATDSGKLSYRISAGAVLEIAFNMEVVYGNSFVGFDQAGQLREAVPQGRNMGRVQPLPERALT